MAEGNQNSKKEIFQELFWLSVVGLFFELMAIRWMGSEVRACSIYKNFPLIACYVGLGFGFMKDTGKEKWFKLFPVFLLLLILLLATSDWTGLAYIMAPSLSTAISTTWWTGTRPPIESSDNITGYVIISLVAFFMLISIVALTFAGIGERLGRLFNQCKPLEAYAINLIGSAIGIFLFSALSFLGTSPAIWIFAGSLPAIWVLRKHKVSIIILVLCVVVPVAVPSRGMRYTDAPTSDCKTMWSPYHRVDMSPLYWDKDKDKPKQERKQVGYTISVNKGYFQQPLNLSSQFVDSVENSKKIKDFIFDQYEFPYQFIKPKSVLILGSGTGNDVAAALRNGAQKVDAVEIDPLMAKLGKQLHPEKPYSSDKVRVFVDDARAFLRKTDEKYDLVLTGFLDSHTVAGNSLSVRLDDYVYTVDGMQSAMSHLNPGGLYSICYCATEDFINRRLTENIRQATGNDPEQKPLILLKEQTAVYHFLVPVKPEMRTRAAELKELGYADISDVDTKGIKASTDDWPYLYLKPAGLDVVYLTVNLIVLALAWLWCGKSIRANHRATRWQLFFLGSAFLLLELSIIDRMALLFGTVWIVNSVCIFAVLLAIILANMVVIKKPSVFRPDVLYGLLFASIVAIYLLPLESAIDLGMYLGGSIAAGISVIPIFLAGLIFSGSFASEKQPGIGLAFNMFGAVIGGLLEYLATFSGIKSLLLISLGLYALSFACLKMAGSRTPDLLADTELAGGQADASDPADDSETEADSEPTDEHTDDSEEQGK